MDNISKQERSGCGISLGGGLSTIGLILLVGLWSVLAEYIIIGITVLALTISLGVKVFGRSKS